MAKTVQVSEQAERAARKVLGRFLGWKVESVAWINREGDEFAAIVCSKEFGEHYEEALEFLTQPGCPLTVVREYTGKYDIRIYVAFNEDAKDFSAWASKAIGR